MRSRRTLGHVAMRQPDGSWAVVAPYYPFKIVKRFNNEEDARNYAAYLNL
jgi:hypothetical protein